MLVEDKVRYVQEIQSWGGLFPFTYGQTSQEVADKASAETTAGALETIIEDVATVAKVPKVKGKGYRKNGKGSCQGEREESEDDHR